jgi:hypothetical protein
MPDLVRIRFTRIPHPRDLEYFALRYIRLDGVYEVPVDLAAELVEFGYASLGNASEPLNDLSAVRPQVPDVDEDDG